MAAQKEWEDALDPEAKENRNRLKEFVNVSQESRMLLVTELFHVQVQEGFSSHLWRFLLPWSYSEIEAIEAGSVKFASQGH